MIRWLLYPLGIFFAVSLLANLATKDWSESLLMLGLFSATAVAIALIEWRDSIRTRELRAEFEALNGLEKCPITPDELRELFEFLDRPNPPVCNHRLSESYKFLQDRGLSIEQTLNWLNANGAGCDCEVIYNTSQRYGPDVGFETNDSFDDSP